MLEDCQIFGTLIANEQQVYDLSYFDDQLVPGSKGILSVVELKVICQRMLEGRLPERDGLLLESAASPSAIIT